MGGGRDSRSPGFGWRDGRRGDGPGGFHADVHGRYPGVIRPYHAGLRIGVHRPVFFRGRRVVACVPSCGFGFFTPVAVPYPVYPAPIYAPPVLADPGYYDPIYYAPDAYAMPGPEYYGGYVEQPPFDGVAAPPPPPASPPAAPTPAEPGAVTPEEQPEDQIAPQPAGETQPATGQQAAAQQSVEQQMAEGMSMFAAGDYEQAGRQFLRLGLADERNIDAWLGYAVARFASRNYEPAAMAIRRAIRAFPDAVNSPVDIRQPYGQPGDFDRQAAALEDHVRAKPDDSDAWLVLGFIRHFSGQRELATRTFEVVQRRFDRDRDLADLFLKAKSPSEIEREAAPPPDVGQGQASPPGQTETPPVDESQAAPLTSEPQVITLPAEPAPQADPAPPPPPLEDLLEEEAQG